jgi:hypothetical protein
MAPARRLEDRIRDLSARLASAQSVEVDKLVSELREAMATRLTQ